MSADGTTTVQYGYDGEGRRFEMQVTSGGTTTTTTYISNLEEIQVTGGTTSKTVYFYYNGQRVAEDQDTNWYYPLNDGLTSTSVVVNWAGIVAAQLYAPYGQVRWAEGTLPTTYGFTGQHSDVTTGLDYYGARYYDPAAGQFISADTVLGKGAGLNRYGYVDGNPETQTDPTGHRFTCGSADCGGGGSGGGSGNDPCNGYVGGSCGHPGGGGGGVVDHHIGGRGTHPSSGVRPNISSGSNQGCGVYDDIFCIGEDDFNGLFSLIRGLSSTELMVVGSAGAQDLLGILHELMNKVNEGFADEEAALAGWGAFWAGPAAITGLACAPAAAACSLAGAGIVGAATGAVIGDLEARRMNLDDSIQALIDDIQNHWIPKFQKAESQGALTYIFLNEGTCTLCSNKANGSDRSSGNEWQDQLIFANYLIIPASSNDNWPH